MHIKFQYIYLIENLCIVYVLSQFLLQRSRLWHLSNSKKIDFVYTSIHPFRRFSYGEIHLHRILQDQQHCGTMWWTIVSNYGATWHVENIICMDFFHTLLRVAKHLTTHGLLWCTPIAIVMPHDTYTTLFTLLDSLVQCGFAHRNASCGTSINACWFNIPYFSLMSLVCSNLSLKEQSSKDEGSNLHEWKSYIPKCQVPISPHPICKPILRHKTFTWESFESLTLHDIHYTTTFDDCIKMPLIP